MAPPLTRTPAEHPGRAPGGGATIGPAPDVSPETSLSGESPAFPGFEGGATLLPGAQIRSLQMGFRILGRNEKFFQRSNLYVFVTRSDRGVSREMAGCDDPGASRLSLERPTRSLVCFPKWHAHTRLPPACSPSLLQEGTPDTVWGTLITAPPGLGELGPPCSLNPSVWDVCSPAA